MEICQQLSVWTALQYTLASLGGPTGNVRGGLRHATGRRLVKRPTLFHVLSATAFSVVLICPALAPQGTKMAPDAKTMTIEGAVPDLACQSKIRLGPPRASVCSAPWIALSTARRSSFSPRPG